MVSVSQVQTLVKEKLTAEGLTVKSEGQIKSNVIDAGLILANTEKLLTGETLQLKKTDRQQAWQRYGEDGEAFLSALIPR